MIRLNCFFQAETDENYKKALRAACTLTEYSRKHEGNIAYDTFQSTTRSDVFMICETWKDQESLDKHSEAKEFKDYVGIMQECGQLKLESFKF